MASSDLAILALVEPMSRFLGREGLAYFQGISDAGRGSLAAANLSLHGGHGIRVRNKMRELLGYPDESTLPEHFYDNNWERLIHLCLNREAKKNCAICEGTGMFRPLPDGFDPQPIEPCPICNKEAPDAR